MGAGQAHPLMRDRAAGLSPALARLLEQASDALTRDQLDAAEGCLRDLLMQAPQSAEALRLLGVAQHLRGRFMQAATLLRQSLALQPDYALTHMNLGLSLHALGAPEALASLQRACRLAPEFAPAWFNCGRALSAQHRPAGAMTALHRALDIEPGHVAARVLLADVQARLGMHDLARTNYREVLQQQPAQPDAWFGLAGLPGAAFADDDLHRLRLAMQAPQPMPARVRLGFALARMLEQRHDYAPALRALGRANALMRRQRGWNAAVASAQVDGALTLFTPTPAGGESAALGAGVILVVSMAPPETAWAAQVLAAHPQVRMLDAWPAPLQRVIDGETQRRQQPLRQWVASAAAADWQRLGREYLALAAAAGPPRPLLVDATLADWRLLGVVLEMLPGARVVDSHGGALEECFDAYRGLFADDRDFSYDLDHLVSHWRDYRRMGSHWRHLSPHRWLDFPHDAARADAASALRELLDFCGLVAATTCLDTLRRQPAARSDAYGGELARLRALLGGAT